MISKNTLSEYRGINPTVCGVHLEATRIPRRMQQRRREINHEEFFWFSLEKATIVADKRVYFEYKELSTKKPRPTLPQKAKQPLQNPLASIEYDGAFRLTSIA